MDIQSLIISSSLLLRQAKVFNLSVASSINVVKTAIGDLPLIEFEQYVNVSDSILGYETRSAIQSARQNLVRQIAKGVEHHLIAAERRITVKIQDARLNREYVGNWAIICGGDGYSKMMQSWVAWGMQWQPNYLGDNYVGMLDRFPVYVIEGAKNTCLVDFDSAQICNPRTSVHSVFVDGNYRVSVAFRAFAAIQKVINLEL